MECCPHQTNHTYQVAVGRGNTVARRQGKTTQMWCVVCGRQEQHTERMLSQMLSNLQPREKSVKHIYLSLSDRELRLRQVNLCVKERYPTNHTIYIAFALCSIYVYSLTTQRNGSLLADLCDFIFAVFSPLCMYPSST